MSVRYQLLILTILLWPWRAQAQAVCSAPAAAVGSLEYFTGTDEYKYCNGSSWVTLPSQGTAPTCSTRGERDWDSSGLHFKYCNGANWRQMVCGAGSATPPQVVTNIIPPRSSCLVEGDTCPDGTKYAGLMGNTHHVFAAPTDSSTGLKWWVGWLTGANSVSDGLSNQQKIVTDFTLSDYPAFEVCKNLNSNGHTDWYLPAPNEAQVLCNNQTAIGGFAGTSYYWTSREDADGSSAYLSNFSDCSTTLTSTSRSSINRPIRCVRRSGADGTCPDIGNTCSNGSKYAGQSGGNHLYVPTTDQASAAANVRWALLGGINTNSNSDGALNQQTVVDSYSLADYPAFQTCKNLNTGGHTDWYLPAKDETNLLSTHQTAIGGFSNAFYWSSTETVSGQTSASVVHFSIGTSSQAKGVTFVRTRCVRKEVVSLSTGGTAITKSSGTSWTALTGVRLASNDSFLVCLASNDPVTSVTWNGVSLTANASATSGVPRVYIYSLIGGTAGTGNLVINGTAGEKAVTVTAVRNLAGSSAFDRGAAAGPTTSTSPSSGATATTTQASEFLFGCVATNGPVENAAGTWSNSFVDDQRNGTTGAGAASNITASSGYRIVTSTGAYTAAKTGITSRPWSAAIATFKSAISSGCSLDGSCSTAGRVDAESGSKYRYCDGANWNILAQ